MIQGCAGKNISGFFSQKFYTVLLVTFVLVVGVMLSLFAIPCTGAEAAVPTKEEIPGIYNTDAVGVEVKFEGDTLNFGGIQCTYDPATGTASYSSASGYVRVQFTKDANGKISVRGKQFMRGYEPPAGKAFEDLMRVPDKTITYVGSKRNQQEINNQNNEKDSEQTLPVEDSGEKGRADAVKERGFFPDIGEEEQDDLPSSDIGKVGAAVGTAIGGGLLGLFT